MERSRTVLQTVMAALAVFIVCTATLRADLLQNEDFLTEVNYAPGSNQGNWLASTTGSLPIQWFADEGGFVVLPMAETDLSGTMLRLEQQADLDPGTYRVNFQFTPNSGPSESDYFRIFAAIDGSSPFAEMLLAHNDGQAMSGNLESGFWDFTVASGPADIIVGFEFERILSDDWDPSWVSVPAWVTIDYAELSLVPVPGAGLLGFVGLGYAGWQLRRRTTAGA